MGNDGSDTYTGFDENENKSGDGIKGETKEAKTLRILLAHWIEHLCSHEEGFREWSQRAKDMDKGTTSRYIENAADALKFAGKSLLDAKKSMLEEVEKMCESKVYILEDGIERKLMDNAIHIEPHDDKLLICDLLGEQIIVDAAIKEIKLLEHKIILEGKKAP